jgi:hypothetical protein
VLREDAHVLSVGAGHEHVLYWLANHVQQVVATDMPKATGRINGRAKAIRSS